MESIFLFDEDLKTHKNLNLKNISRKIIKNNDYNKFKIKKTIITYSTSPNISHELFWPPPSPPMKNTAELKRLLSKIIKDMKSHSR